MYFSSHSSVFLLSVKFRIDRKMLKIQWRIMQYKAKVGGSISLNQLNENNRVSRTSNADIHRKFLTNEFGRILLICFIRIDDESIKFVTNSVVVQMEMAIIRPQIEQNKQWPQK